jgi:hypothetical protein
VHRIARRSRKKAHKTSPVRFTSATDDLAKATKMREKVGSKRTQPEESEVDEVIKSTVVVELFFAVVVYSGDPTEPPFREWLGPFYSFQVPAK